eukprot:1925668-Amphidinium_carterae.1
MPGPPRPPPPKQASASLQRDMEQAMAIAKAKNASEDTGWASNLVEAAVRAKDAMNAALHAEGPRAVVKPAPTCPLKKPPGPFFASPHRSDDDEPTGLTVMSPAEPVLLRDGNIPHGKMVMSPTMPELSDVMVPPDNWEIDTAAAAKKAAAVIAQAKEKAFPSTPKAKPGPKGFEYVHTTGKVPSSCPILKAILDRNGDEPLPPPPEIKPPPVRYTPAERNALAAASERQQRRDRMMTGPSTDVILRNAQQALEQAKARQQKQPPIKGSNEHKRTLLNFKRI